MSTLIKTLGYITCCASVSYLTLTSMMQDPHKPYRGHLNIRSDDYEKQDELKYRNKEFNTYSKG